MSPRRKRVVQSPSPDEGGDESPSAKRLRAEASAVAMVTPATSRKPKKIEDAATKKNARRELFPTPGVRPIPVSPVPSREQKAKESPAKRKLVFGRLVEQLDIQDNVRQVYGIVKKLTGSIGGNASSGPIYGELTMHSMQRMINLMKKHTDFDNTSRFIDVGSGIGKPNLHVAQDPGVEFSYGIEVEFDRWLLGMNCLKGVLDAANTPENTSTPTGEKILHRCVFEHADMRKADSFDPFTHVYMFSIGFPPMLWIDLSAMWNKSNSSYLICYHGPRAIIDEYEFNVELVAQMSTSMHGSKESHMGYIYQRTGVLEKKNDDCCDPAFQDAWDRAKQNVGALHAQVNAELERCMSSGPCSRTRRRRCVQNKE